MSKLETYKKDIVTHFDKLEMMMNKQVHLTNPKKVYKHMSKVEYKWHFIEEDDREFYQGCLFALENASGKDWRHVIKRSRGFKGYELRIQRTYHDTIYNCWKYEQQLHEKFKHDSYKPKQKFGGHTECFKISSLILSDFPKNNS